MILALAIIFALLCLSFWFGVRWERENYVPTEILLDATGPYILVRTQDVGTGKIQTFGWVGIDKGSRLRLTDVALMPRS